MTTVAYDVFLPEVMPQVSGQPVPVAINAIRNAVIEFCEYSHVLQKTTAVVTLDDTDFPYAPVVDTGTRFVIPLEVYADDFLLGPVDQDVLANRVFGWRTQTGPQPIAYYLPDSDRIAVYPRVEGDIDFYARLAVCPTRASMTCDEFLYETYLDAIATGALVRLGADPDGKRAKAWRAAKDAARIEANKSFTRETKQVQLRRYA